MLPAAPWRRNVFAVAAASFIGFASFTLVMPFLPLFIRQLGVTDVGEIALWTGVALAVTPALNAVVSPFWGRLADRYGRRIMVVRSLGTCVLVMTGMAFVTHPWQVVALRSVLGLLTGYGGLTLTMAAESAPAANVASAIGTVQTAQRLGPAVGPIVGGTVAGLLGLRGAFLVTAALYVAALVLVLALYDERAVHAPTQKAAEPHVVTFRNVLAFQNFLLLMLAIFVIQFADRSIGPVLSLYVEQMGVAPAAVAVVSGVMFSIAAFAGAVGNHLCARLIARVPARVLIVCGAAAAGTGSVLVAAAPNLWALGAAATAFGVGLGLAMTAAYTAAAAVIPAGAHGVGFGVLTSASLTGLAVSPLVAGAIGAASIRTVFVVDAVMMGALALTIWKRMV